MAWNGDGNRLASGSDDKTIRIWDTRSGECLKTLEGHSSAVTSVAWNGNLLAASAYDDTIEIFNVGGPLTKPVKDSNAQSAAGPKDNDLLA